MPDAIEQHLKLLPAKHDEFARAGKVGDDHVRQPFTQPIQVSVARLVVKIHHRNRSLAGRRRQSYVSQLAGTLGPLAKIDRRRRGKSQHQNSRRNESDTLARKGSKDLSL